MANTTQLKQKWFKDNGFNSEGSTFVVFGEAIDSAIDELKELGYQYSSFFGWHSPELLDLPSGCKTTEIQYNKYMVWDSITNKMIFKKNAKENFLAQFDS